MLKPKMKSSKEINDMIQLCSRGCTVTTITQLLDIVQALNERMDAIESTTNQTQHERNHPSNTNSTFTFQCVLRFEIDPETAASLLVEGDPTVTVHKWLLTQMPSFKDTPYSGNAEDLRSKLGEYLAEKKVNRARLLLPCPDVAQLTY